MVAPVAQLDRASASGVEGRGFESRRVYQFFCLFSGELSKKLSSLFFLPLFPGSIKGQPFPFGVKDP